MPCQPGNIWRLESLYRLLFLRSDSVVRGRRVVAAEAQTAFISYSREDSEFALRLAGDLKAAGAAVWLDQLDIAPGQRWAKAVQDALNDCPRMLVILSPSSASSTNVDDEVSFALEEKKTVIPVLYRECKIPFRLRPFQYVDFRSDYALGLTRLLQTLPAESPPAQVAPIAKEPSNEVPIDSVAKLASGAVAEVVVSSPTSEPDRGEHKPIRARGNGQFAAFLRFPSRSQALRKIAIYVSGFALAALIWYGPSIVSRYRGERQGRGAGESLSSPSNAKMLSSPAEGSWKNRTSGISAELRVSSNLFSVTFATPELGWAVGASGLILHTEDGGTKWTRQSAAINDIANLYSVAFATRLSGWAIGFRGSGQHSEGVILRTEDGGNTWKQQSSDTTKWLFSVTFPAPQSGWVVGTDGIILHTEDGGNKWKQQSGGTTVGLFSVAFVSAQSGWAVGQRGVILHTEDAGETWKVQRSGAENANLLSVTFPAPQSVWVVGSDGVILHTEDGGITWNRQTSGTKENLNSVVFLTPLSGWAVGNKGVVLHTEDGGKTWKEQVSGTGSDLRSVAFPTSRSGWAVGEKGTILHWKND